MDEFSSGYQPEDYSQGGAKIEEGDYKIRIETVVPGYSQSSGNPMLTLTMGIAEASFKLFFYLVKNEYFNSDVTKFFDCFKIPRGNFEYNRWIGRVGAAHIAKGKPKENGKQYMEIAYLIVPQAPGAAPSAQPPVPPPARASAPAPRQGPAARPPVTPQDDFSDDIPF